MTLLWPGELGGPETDPSLGSSCPKEKEQFLLEARGVEEMDAWHVC